MKLTTRLTAGFGAVILASIGVLAVAGPASAHTIDVSATCTTLSLDLENYAGSQPGEDAVPAVTHDVPHHDLLTPEIAAVPGTAAIPGVPAVPAVPTTYVQEWKFVQKNHPGQFQWHTADWNPGYGWTKTGDHRDSTTVLKQGTPAIPAVPEVPATPGTPAIPATYHDWTETVTDTPAKDAVPAKTNHLVVTIDGTSVDDEDFSTSDVRSFTFGDSAVAHDWTVDVTAWDSSNYSFHRSGTSTPCVVVTPPTQLTIAPVTQTAATCDAGVTYTIPEQDEHIKYELVDGVRPTPGTYTLAAGQTVTIGAHVAAQYLVENGGTYLPASYSVTIVGGNAQVCAPEKPADVVSHNTSEVKDCTAGIITVHHTTTTQGWTLDEETNTYVASEPVTTQDPDTTRQATDEECPAVVIPPVTPKPTPTPTTVAPKPVAPAAVPAAAAPVLSNELAETGSETELAAALAGFCLLLIAGGATLFFVNRARTRKANR